MRLVQRLECGCKFITEFEVLMHPDNPYAGIVRPIRVTSVRCRKHRRCRERLYVPGTQWRKS